LLSPGAARIHDGSSCLQCSLIITGNLPGQEEGNPAYMQKYNLGVVCKDVRKLRHTVNELLENNGEKLNRIKQSQKEFLNPNVAKEIASFLLSIDKQEEPCFLKICFPAISLDFGNYTKEYRCRTTKK